MLTKAHVLASFLQIASELFQPTGLRSHTGNLKIFTASLSGLWQAGKQMRTAFLFQGCCPCNLEVQTVTPENRKKNSGAYLKTDSVWGLQCHEQSRYLKLATWNPVVSLLSGLRGEILFAFRSFSLAPYSKFHKGDSRRNRPQLKKQRWKPDLCFF